MNTELFDLEEAYSYNMKPKDKREVKEIIYKHFDVIEKEWNKLKNRG